MLDTVVGPMDQLVRALENLRAPINSPQFKVPNFNDEGEVVLFVAQFRDSLHIMVGQRSTLLHLKGCLEGPARSHRRGDSTEEILKSLRSRYGTSPQQAKERLLGLILWQR